MQQTEDVSDEPNAAAKAILASAIEKCVSSSFAVEACVWADNPAWHAIRDALDEATDVLRDAEAALAEVKDAE